MDRSSLKWEKFRVFSGLYHRKAGKTTTFPGKRGLSAKNILRFPLYKAGKDCYNNQAVKQMRRWLNG
jgi:hypothetical protein